MLNDTFGDQEGECGTRWAEKHFVMAVFNASES